MNDDELTEKHIDDLRELITSTQEEASKLVLDTRYGSDLEFHDRADKVASELQQLAMQMNHITSAVRKTKLSVLTEAITSLKTAREKLKSVADGVGTAIEIGQSIELLVKIVFPAA